MTSYKSDFLNVLAERELIHQVSDPVGLDAQCMAGTVTGYVGYDATATSIHIGNLITVTLLYWLQQTGHKPISLMGGGTSMVGDPSFRDDQRQLLTMDQIDTNISSIKKVYSRILKYGDGPTDAVMVNNADWLMKLNYIEFIRDVGRHFSINRMLSFDSVKLRLDREQSLSFLEFNYMIMQGYDFVELNRRYGCTLQMGGSDQWGNIINGVDLGHRMLDTQFYAVTTPLLTTSSGQKMGKSASGAVWLNDELFSAYDFWQYFRNSEDADVGKFLKIFTRLSLEDIAHAVKDDINEAKKLLATEVTAIVHGREAADQAAETARATFEQGAISQNLPTEEITPEEWESISSANWKFGRSAAQILSASRLVNSKGEARRKIEEGAVRINDQLMSDPKQIVPWSEIDPEIGAFKVQLGKKKIALVRRTE